MSHGSDDPDALRRPIGPFEPPEAVSATTLKRWIGEIEELPVTLRELVGPLDAKRLDTRYRPGGWTVRQVVHHLADSHLNSFVRFKWALTEPEPTIKAYDEKRWAELADSALPVEPSLDLLDALHARWALLLRSLSAKELRRGFVHPETGERVQLDVNVGAYAWHGRHHVAQIASLATRSGWI